MQPALSLVRESFFIRNIGKYNSVKVLLVNYNTSKHLHKKEMKLHRLLNYMKLIRIKI